MFDGEMTTPAAKPETGMTEGEQMMLKAMRQMADGQMTGRETADTLGIPYMQFRDGLRGKGRFKWLSGMGNYHPPPRSATFGMDELKDVCFKRGMLRDLMRLSEQFQAAVLWLYKRHMKACESLGCPIDGDFLRDAIYEAARMQRRQVRV